MTLNSRAQKCLGHGLKMLTKQTQTIGNVFHKLTKNKCARNIATKKLAPCAVMSCPLSVRFPVRFSVFYPLLPSVLFPLLSGCPVLSCAVLSFVLSCHIFFCHVPCAVLSPRSSCSEDATRLTRMLRPKHPGPCNSLACVCV